MNDILSSLHQQAQPYIELAKEYPYRAAGAAVGVGLTLLAACKLCCRENRDLTTVKRIAKEIFELQPTICDASDYPFLETHKVLVPVYKCREASQSYQAAVSKAHAEGRKVVLNAEAILQLAQDFFNSNSGMCDHLAAAVILKIVDHINSGGKWNSTVELVGTKGHAYVVLNRQKDSSLSESDEWGRRAIVVDTWLGCCKVNKKNKHELTAGHFGVISKPKEIAQHTDFFDPELVTYRFSVAELHQLAAERKQSPVASIKKSRDLYADHEQRQQRGPSFGGVSAADLLKHRRFSAPAEMHLPE